MARIRSIHPGQWTDEAFVAVSPLARLLALGLRNEADDEGVFPWKPLTLKMRLLPADNADVADLLAELEAANIVRKYEVGGSHYGAIRNFYLFQRPKFPKITHPRLAWVPAYCGRKGDRLPDEDAIGSEPLEERFGTDAEIAPQMESESESESESEGGVGEAAPKQNTGPKARAQPSKRVRSLEALELDDELRALARERGRLAADELDSFRDWVRARGKRYDDYRAAFRNWLRSPYGKPQTAPAASQPLPQPSPSNPYAHLSKWEYAQLKRRCEAVVKAEGESPFTAEGMIRVNQLMLSEADAQRSPH